MRERERGEGGGGGGGESAGTAIYSGPTKDGVMQLIAIINDVNLRWI